MSAVPIPDACLPGGHIPLGLHRHTAAYVSEPKYRPRAKLKSKHACRDDVSVIAACRSLGVQPRRCVLSNCAAGLGLLGAACLIGGPSASRQSKLTWFSSAHRQRQAAESRHRFAIMTWAATLRLEL